MYAVSAGLGSIRQATERQPLLTCERWKFIATSTGCCQLTPEYQVLFCSCEIEYLTLMNEYELLFQMKVLIYAVISKVIWTHKPHKCVWMSVK